MIDEVARGPGPPLRRRLPDRWRQWWLGIFALVLVLTAGVLGGCQLRSQSTHPVAAPSSLPVSHLPLLESSPSPSTTPSGQSASPSTAPGGPPAPDLSRLLQLPGAVPTHGSHTFRYASRAGPVLGTKGPLRSFRVGVENGSGEDVETFAAQVQATLGDRRSWTGGGTVRLRLVAGGQPYDFSVLLVTRNTAREMCAAGGTNIAINGRPYTSCRTTGKAIINLDRWRLSANPFLAAKVPLATYRQYVINHEVGHELGHGHVTCPKAGGPAPVMVQQTITLRGCVPNAWPRVGGGFLTGPSI